MPHQARRRRATLVASLATAAVISTTAPTPARAAQPLVHPGDLIVNTFGNLFDSPLDKMDLHSGDRTRIANNGLLNRAYATTSDSAGNLYVANLFNVIIKIDHVTGQQQQVTVTGQGISARDLLMSPSGKLLVAGETVAGGSLVEIDPATFKPTVLTSGGLLGKFVTAGAVEHNGDVLLVDSGNRQIVRVDAVTRQQHQLATFNPGHTVGAIAVANDGSILVRDNLADAAHTPTIVKIDPRTGLKSILVKGNKFMHTSTGMTRDAAGTIYLSERAVNNNTQSTVLVMDPTFPVPGLLGFDGESDSLDVHVVASQIPPVPRPVAKPDAFTMERPSGELHVVNGVLANDSDPLGQPLVAEKVTEVKHGFTSFFDSGEFFYFPATGFVGDDTMTYRVRAGNRVSDPVTVTFHVLPEQAPVARNDFFSTPFGKALILDEDLGPSFNDFDPQGDPVSARVITQAKHGLASFDTANTMAYQPAANFSGDDSFTYQLTDGKHKSNIATVTISVGNPPPANKAPSISVVKGGTINTAGTGATANLTISDPETGANLLALKAASSNQTLLPNSAIRFSGTANSRTVAVTPKTGVTGTATVTLTVTDGGGLNKGATITVKVDDNGDHTLTGTAGTDMLFGLGGQDTLDGAGGIDLIAGGAGDDTMTGGSGADLFRGGTGTNKVTDFSATDGDSGTEIVK